MRKLAITASLLLLTATPALATCYELYLGDTRIYQGEKPPFDISLSPQPSNDLIESRKRGERLVFFEPACYGSRFGSNSSAKETAHDGTTLGRSIGYQYAPLSYGAGGSGPRYAGRYGSRTGSPGTDVHVQSYIRKDGVRVSAHTRSAPRRR